MAIRIFTPLENACIQLIHHHYLSSQCECAILLESPAGKIVEVAVSTLVNSVSLSSTTITRAQSGDTFILHHNHPSQGSISEADWDGALNLHYSEIFVHSSEGTIYWATCLDESRLRTAMQEHCLDQMADAELSDVLNAAQLYGASPYSSQLSMHVANLALHMKGIVDYDVHWGSGHTRPSQSICQPPCPVNVLVKQLNSHCVSAAQLMASKI